MSYTQLKLLVVDDMMTMRKLVIKACKEIGFTDISEAADGALAWQTLSTSPTPFGLVLSDWNMPNSTGMDLLKRVRADGKMGKMPFILLTAESEGTQVAEALSVGVSNYIIKPFTVDSLRLKLDETFARIKAA